MSSPLTFLPSGKRPSNFILLDKSQDFTSYKRPPSYNHKQQKVETKHILSASFTPSRPSVFNKSKIRPSLATATTNNIFHDGTQTDPTLSQPFVLGRSGELPSPPSPKLSSFAFDVVNTTSTLERPLSYGGLFKVNLFSYVSENLKYDFLEPSHPFISYSHSLFPLSLTAGTSRIFN